MSGTESMEVHAFPPESATVQVEVAARTRAGTGRVVNTDHHLVVRLARRFDTVLTSLDPGHVPEVYDERGYALVVADGIGDGAAAESASRLAIVSLAHLALVFGHWRLRLSEDIADDVIQQLDRFYRFTHGLLDATGKAHETGPLRSSLTAAVSAGDQLFVAHAGHSRAYLFRGGTLIQLTRDHTVVSHRAAAAAVAPTGAGLQDGPHVLVNTLGSPRQSLAIEVKRVILVDNDLVVVCTNGLTDALPDDRIVQILGSDAGLEGKVQMLLDAAFAEAQAADDVTAVAARYQIRT
jgi:protein phosphatase